VALLASVSPGVGSSGAAPWQGEGPASKSFIVDHPTKDLAAAIAQPDPSAAKVGKGLVYESEAYDYLWDHPGSWDDVVVLRTSPDLGFSQEIISRFGTGLSEKFDQDKKLQEAVARQEMAWTTAGSRIVDQRVKESLKGSVPDTVPEVLAAAGRSPDGHLPSGGRSRNLKTGNLNIPAVLKGVLPGVDLMACSPAS
jgi:hypothetical protein